MNTYRVTFAPLHDIDNIQRTPILANSAEEVPTIFGDCVILEIEEQHAVELASALDLDPQAEARETERDTAWVGELVGHPIQKPSSNLQLLIASGAVDEQGRLKPYKASGHRSEPMTLEELGDYDYPY